MLRDPSAVELPTGSGMMVPPTYIVRSFDELGAGGRAERISFSKDEDGFQLPMVRV